MGALIYFSVMHQKSLIWIVQNTYRRDIRAIDGEPTDWLHNDTIRSRYIFYYNPSIVLTGIGFDYRKRYLFLSDPGTRSILRATLPYGRGQLSTKYFHLDVSPGVGQLAVDWISQNVYWVDSLYDRIGVRSYAVSAENYTRVIVETDLDRPEGIAVHPLQG